MKNTRPTSTAWFRAALLAPLMCASVLIAAQSAKALTVDSFNNTQDTVEPLEDIVTSSVNGLVATQAFTVPAALGGFRTLAATKVSGSLNVDLSVESGVLNYAQGPDGSGKGKVIWDGNNDSSSLNAVGLGGINFRQDLATDDPANDGFYLDVVFLDLSAKIKVTVYSAANKASSLTRTLSSPISSKQAIKFLFKDFVKLDSASSAADFSSVGAVMLEVEGSVPAVDLVIDKLYTNGCNPVVPTKATSSVDQCNVICGKDACLDCTGIPDISGDGPNQPGKPCDTGDLGECKVGVWQGPKPSCTCTTDYQPLNERCDGLDNNCDGSTDESFPTKGQACSQGSDLCSVNGTIVCTQDELAVRCTADDKLDEVKACDSTRGCDGVPNSGLVLDACGVCGGDSSSCADCRKVPNGPALLDRCGVCEGDGSSCLECQEFDITQTQFELDGGAKDQEKNIISALRDLERIDSSAGTKSFINKLKADAHELQILNWTLSWTLPSVFSSCTNSFCVQATNAPSLDEYRARSAQLEDLGKKAIARLIKTKRARGVEVNKKDKRLSLRNQKLHENNLKLADTVPVVVSACS
jgi:hypothetical protein